MLFKMLAVAAVATALGTFAAPARTMDGGGSPAELPPPGFKGSQYVDSQGCIFMRAGYGGQTSWVPRVTRDRKVICGYKPTFAAGRAAPAAPGGEMMAVSLAPPTPTAPPPVGPAIASAAPLAKPSAGMPMATIAGSPAPAPMPAPKPVKMMAAPAPTGPSIKGKPVTIVTHTACPDLDRVAQVYMLDDGRNAVRCGPQDASPSGSYMVVRVANQTAPAPAFAAAPAPMAAPTNFAAATPAPQPIPKGYREAWRDGRLNPMRGPRSSSGTAEMNLVWTQTVPRKLIDTRSANVVTSQYPWLSYPVTAQPPLPTYSSKYVRVVRKNGGTVARLSTSNAPAAPAAAYSGGGRYVQVGSFGVPANANRTATRLRAMGLPVRMGTVRMRGKTLQTVMAGPFTAQNQLVAALGTARSAGFADAYIRN